LKAGWKLNRLKQKNQFAVENLLQINAIERDFDGFLL
jgi:LysM repeat protein